MSAHDHTDGYLNWIHTGSPFPQRCENCRHELPAHWEDELCAKCQRDEMLTANEDADDRKWDTREAEADERYEAREGL
jgi:hypothetical protein